MSVRGTPRGSDENLQYSAASDSFWDVGNFKRTVKRIDDGAKLCDEFMKLVAERAEIEAKYAFKLKAWSKKWEECIKSGPEYGTMEAAMRGTVTEAESRAETHILCRNKLMDEVHEAIKGGRMKITTRESFSGRKRKRLRMDLLGRKNLGQNDWPKLNGLKRHFIMRRETQNRLRDWRTKRVITTQTQK